MISKSHLRGTCALIAMVGLPATATMAADHREAPLIREDLTADINDVYAFLSPADPERVVLAMTVNPFTAPPENSTYVFSPDVRYSFRIDNDGDAMSDVDVVLRFTDPALGFQDFEFRVFGAELNGMGSGNGQIAFSGSTTPGTEAVEANEPIITNGPGDITVFAGQRDDPFFFDVVGFSRFLAGTGGFDGTDGFAGVNVSAIVVELPVALLMSNGEGMSGSSGSSSSSSSSSSHSHSGSSGGMMGTGDGTLQIWGTTDRRRNTIRRSSQGKLAKHKGPWQQVDRMGNPAINTALIPLAQKDFYNIGGPADDAADFAGTIVASLQSLGTNDENIGILASVALPDTLKLDPTTASGYPNGRALADDVVNTLFFFIFNQTPVSDGVDANDVPFLDVFPYLASPHQPG